MQLKKSLKIIIITVSACVFTVISALGTYAFFPQKYKKEVYSVCENTKIDTSLIFAIIKTESSFKKDKISPKGAVGLMQIMPDTAEYISKVFFGGNAYNLHSPKDNILYGVTYLIYLTEKFEDIKTALAAYNAGEGRVYEWLDNKEFSLDGKTLISIPYNETKLYVKKVMRYKNFYEILY
ncbi:MAG: lytic transglycosylase domain-containing protein [Clostridiales bacterium]|nr:lytic transglycosylase domain-containing protein [Clostridiales bacterium]